MNEGRLTSSEWPEMAVRPGAAKTRSDSFGFVALAVAAANLVWTAAEVRRVESLADPEPPYFFFLVICWAAAIVAGSLGAAVLWISAGRGVDLVERPWVARLGVYSAAAAVLLSGGLLVWSFVL